MNATVTAIKTKAETALAEQFAARRSSGAASVVESGAVTALRAASFERFARVGLPHKRIEAWHFTDLRNAMREAYAPCAPVASAAKSADASVGGALRLVLVDGAFQKPSAEELPAGLRIRSLRDALTDATPEFLDALCPPGLGDDAMVALNAAFMSDGVVIELAAGVALSQPIEVVWAGEADGPGAVTARCLIQLGAGAKLTLKEAGHAPSSPRQINSAFVFALGEASELTHVWSPPHLAEGSIHVESVIVTLGARARFASTSLAYGAPFLRRQGFIRFDGAQAEASLAGLCLLRASEQVDNTLFVEHVVGGCKSRELFKHIVDGAANGVFQGKIMVAPGAQKTNGVMQSRAILLSEDAAMDNKPELEIFADDVVCGHGATCGELDENQLFYAMSRGLPRLDAQALLLEAFAAEALQGAPDDWKEEAAESLRQWLGQRRSVKA